MTTLAKLTTPTSLTLLTARLRARLADDEGASTAEYAIVVMASVALAAVLVAVAQSGAVQSAIEDLMISAFNY